MDYIIALDDTQVVQIVKPFVELINAGSQLMFADSDFVYTKDEFMRDTPGKYELKIGWVRGLGDMSGRFLITTLKLIHPQRLNTTELHVQKRLTRDMHEKYYLLLDLFLQQIEVGQGQDSENFLRLTW